MYLRLTVRAASGSFALASTTGAMPKAIDTSGYSYGECQRI